MRHYVLPALLLFYLVLWIGGIASYLLHAGPPADMLWTAPAFLLLAGAILLATSPVFEIKWLLLGGIMGFSAEVVGVYSSVIFSAYHYTDVLQPTLKEVPLVMISAWMVLIGYVRQMLKGFSRSKWLTVLYASTWMTAIDLVIDPLAGGVLGYWRWSENGMYYGIPAHNFLGWFVVSFLIFLFLRGPVIKNVWAERTGLSIILFFTLLSWIFGLILPGIIGLVLFSLHVIVPRANNTGRPCSRVSETPLQTPFSLRRRIHETF